MIKVSNREANNMSDRNYKVKGKKMLPNVYNLRRRQAVNLAKSIQHAKEVNQNSSQYSNLLLTDTLLK